MPVTVEQVYAAQESLSKGEQVSSSMSVIMQAVKSDSFPVRALAAQALPQYAHLHTQHETALDAHIDLCEDTDPVVRLHAIRGLAVLCKGIPELAARVADILGQLSATGDAKELAAVKQGLSAVLVVDKKATLESLFRLVKQETEVRDALVPVLVETLHTVEETLLEWLGEQIGALAKSKDIDSELFMQIFDSLAKSQIEKAKKNSMLANIATKWIVVQDEFDVILFLYKQRSL
jgi:HEAT repeat protein